MNPPTQSPPPGHRAPRHRVLRDVLGLLLIVSGVIGLLGALHAADPRAAEFVSSLILCVGGSAVLYIAPPLSKAVRYVAGYGALWLGLALLASVTIALSPWTWLFALVVSAGVYLSMSSEGD
ncbi:hypothetical protein [Streptomyces sp. NPDC004267]|uniref:hypothetical protein n=1 Tax=Streptomyces sp. NPDC004267 TaxID=3364694 RepID=UPI0036A34529